MARSMRIGLRLLCVLFLAGLYGCQYGDGGLALERETRVVTVGHQKDSGLRVTTSNGGVTVRRADRPDVQITAELRTLDKDRLAEVAVVARRDDSGVLEVYADWPGGKPKNNEACSFEVLLPDATVVELKTSNGAVRIEHVGTEAVLKTSNGAVVAEDVPGPVTVRTSNGAITVTGVAGPVNAHTSNGKIEVSGSGGAIKAETSNGAIDARDVSGPFDLSTSNGAIEVTVTKDFAGEVELRSSTGKVEVVKLNNVEVMDSGKSRMHLRVGGGEAVSTAHTSNGRVRMMSEE